MYTWNTTNVYKGEFALDKLSGLGEMTYHTTGHHYKGMWANNMKDGRGLFKYSDGNIYDGEFKDDVMHGWGKFTWVPGSILEESYAGEWERGRVA